LLTEAVKVWQDFTIYATMMDRCFNYLNRYHLSNSSQPPIGATCLAMFKELIFGKLKKPVTHEILAALSKDRNGEAVSREILKHSI